MVPSRRQQILEALAQELENSPGSRITTARLAEAVGVSEAALYRHFPSKAKMFEALIEFAEESVFSLVNKIIMEEQNALRRCENIMVVLLGFAERNPGITRILLGDALVGENEQLQNRVGQFFARIETQLRQILREGEVASELRLMSSAGAMANLMISVIGGKMVQYTRSRFKHHPLEGWSEQWPLLAALLLG